MSNLLPPSSRATTARRSLRGERWPLSSALGTGEFYVLFAPANKCLSGQVWRHRARVLRPSASSRSPLRSGDNSRPALGERALEGGPIARPTVRGEHMLDRALEQRAQALGDLCGRHAVR